MATVRAADPGLAARARATLAEIAPDLISGTRWSGLGGRPVRDLRVVDAFGFEDGGLLVVIDVTAEGTSPPARLTLPAVDAPPWRGLHELARNGESVVGIEGGYLRGDPPTPGGPRTGPAATPTRAIRPVPGDQSHTSLIIDESVVLKLYRRISEPPSPEPEVLSALARFASQLDAPVPAWRGAVTLELADGFTTTIAIQQAFVPDAADAFEWLADGLAGSLADGAKEFGYELVSAAGHATGRLHRALASIPEPPFQTRPGTPEDRHGWLQAASLAADAAVDTVASLEPALAEQLARARPAIDKALAPLGDSRRTVQLQRIHGDLHLGQILPAPDGVLFIDFEGDPTRQPAERIAAQAPVRDVAAFLRSIDHVARSARRRAVARGFASPPTGSDDARMERWIAAARAAFLDHYAAGLGDRAWRVDEPLLRAFEVKKELAEFVYAARFLPPWLYAPIGGLRALLGAAFDAPAGP
ncbi:MAG: phosphotransferase [Candidatus Limnocylindrales bacterium]